MTSVQLTKPITVNGSELKSIELDFDKLDGNVWIFCEAEAVRAQGGVPMLSPVTDGAFHVQVAAKASGIAVEVLRSLPFIEFGAVVGAVRSFLLGAD